MAMTREEAWERARRTGGLVWHYTSLGVLQRILENGSFYATEVNFQNDITETQTADDAFAAALAELEAIEEHAAYVRSIRGMFKIWDGEPDTFTSVYSARRDNLTNDARFIFCASQEPDHLYAWRTYGSKTDIGCAIGILPSARFDVAGGGSQARVAKWQKVIYDRDALVELAKDRILKKKAVWEGERERGPGHEGMYPLYLDIEFVRTLLRARGKDASFVDEHEQRITVVDARDDTKIVTTTSAMGPRPHVELVPRIREKDDADVTLPIRAIRLGPDAPQSAVKATEWLLHANGYPLDPVAELSYPGLGEGEPIDQDTIVIDEPDWGPVVLVDRSRLPYRNA